MCIDAKGQLSGADDSVCVCVICAWLRVFASVLIYLSLTAWHMCLFFECVATMSVCLCVCVCGNVCVCVFVCVCVRRGTWVGSEGNAMLRCPHCPLVMRMPPVCHCRHGYCSKKGGAHPHTHTHTHSHTHTHRLSSLLMCHRGAGPAAALSPLLHTLCCNYKPAPRSTQKEPIMAISSLSCFKAACNSLTRLTLASVC